MGLTVWQVLTSREDMLNDAKALAEALSRVGEEHFAGVMRSIDHILVEAVELTPDSGQVDVAQFQDLMRQRITRFRSVQDAFIVGADGLVRGATTPGFSGIDVRDRDYFRAFLTDSALPLYVSVPLVSRAQPVMSIFIARALRDSAGAFRGLVVVVVDPRLFEDELRTIRPSVGGFATLLRIDGVILARVPDGEKLAGRVVTNAPATTAAATKPSGVMRGRGAVDGEDRILAYRRLADYPLLVVVGVRLDQVLAAWAADAFIHGGVGLALAVMAWLMAAVSDRNHAERVLALQALADSESRYRLLTDHSPLGIIHSDRHGRTLYANRRWLELVGREPAQVIGAKWCDCVDPADRVAVQTDWDAMVEGGGEFTSDLQVLTPSGERRWLRGRASSLDRLDGDTGMVATFEDVTAAREAEQGLRLSEDKFSRAFMTSPDALVISTRKGGRYVDVNDAYCVLLGYDREEFLSSNSLSLGVWANPRERVRLVDILDREGRVDGFETILRRKDGKPLVILISAQGIDIGGETCILFICHDVTERREMESRTRQLVAKLDASNKELEQFAYVASHDLQEPLRMIAGYSQLLERRYRGRLDADADEFIGYLVEGAKRMRALIQDLLEYSRVERQGEAFVECDMRRILDDVALNLRAAIGEAGAKLVIGPMPTLAVDRSQMVRLFQNLIGNALKYRDPDRGAEIAVTAEPVGGDWKFSVQDNGIGIEQQYFDRIFMVFQRLHTRDKFEGTGIGLAICKKIVERHGGRIWVESTVGEGAVFRFTIGGAVAGSHRR